MFYFLGYIIYMILSSVGITFGYHRYFSHREFKVSNLTEVIMLCCGVICGGRDPLSWVGVHRMHHAFSDTNQDPHPSGWRALLSVWRVNNIPRRFIRDMYCNSNVMWFHKYHKIVWLGSAVLCIGIIELWITVQLLSWLGFGLLNYFGHKEGKPVNVRLLNLIAPFEGNHADHHQGKPTALGTIGL